VCPVSDPPLSSPASVPTRPRDATDATPPIGEPDPLDALRSGRGPWREQVAGRFGSTALVTWHVPGRSRGLTVVVAVLTLVSVAAAVGLVVVVRGTGPRAADEPLPMTSRGRSPSSTARGASASGAPAGPGDAGSAGGASSGAGDGSGSSSGAGGAVAGTAVASLWVDVGGAVARPGLYAVRSGARLAEAVAAAGGLAPDADADRVNLAALVVDGERIYVPRRGDVSVPPLLAGGGGAGGSAAGGDRGGSSGADGRGPTAATTSAPTAPVDLNLAGADELDRLPGVGPATAAAIIAYRDQHGPFRSVDDLAEVRGIGRAKLEQLRPLVRVN
jgi:competence protein ComEA